MAAQGMGDGIEAVAAKSLVAGRSVVAGLVVGRSAVAGSLAEFLHRVQT